MALRRLLGKKRESGGEQPVMNITDRILNIGQMFINYTNQSLATKTAAKMMEIPKKFLALPIFPKMLPKPTFEVNPGEGSLRTDNPGHVHKVEFSNSPITKEQRIKLLEEKQFTKEELDILETEGIKIFDLIKKVRKELEENGNIEVLHKASMQMAETTPCPICGKFAANLGIDLEYLDVLKKSEILGIPQEHKIKFIKETITETLDTMELFTPKATEIAVVKGRMEQK